MEVASLVALVVSPLGGYISGAKLRVDGAYVVGINEPSLLNGYKKKMQITTTLLALILIAIAQPNPSSPTLPAAGRKATSAKPVKKSLMTNTMQTTIVDTRKTDALFALGQAGAMHQRLQPLIGDWNVQQRIFTGAETPPILSVGVTAHKKWIMDGRDIQEEMSGTLAGIEMHKLTFLGYNNVNARYEFTTFDNLDTQTMTYHGQPDATGKVITMTAPYTQAVYGSFVSGDGISKATGAKLGSPTIVGVSFTVRDVLTITDNDHHTLQMFFTPAGGKESLSVQYDYTRR